MKFSPGSVIESSIKCLKVDSSFRVEYLTHRWREDELPWEREFEWKLSELFCPSCGAKGQVYTSEDIEEDNADEQHLCLSCGFGFMHPMGVGQQYNEVPDSVIKAMMEI